MGENTWDHRWMLLLKVVVVDLGAATGLGRTVGEGGGTTREGSVVGV